MLVHNHQLAELAVPKAEISRFREWGSSISSGQSPACDLRQSEHAQAEARSLADTTPTGAFSHSHLLVLAEHGGILVQHPQLLGLQNLTCSQARQLREAIDQFAKVYQETAAPFEWTKQLVYASAPKKRYSDFMQVITSGHLPLPRPAP